MPTTLTSVNKKKFSNSGDVECKPVVSFLYDAGNYAAEWELEYGPIQVWSKCDADSIDAREHYYYEYVTDSPLDFSQLAVERAELKQAAISGNFPYIFSVLKDWANRI
jgi:hypothetical protein